MKPVRPDVPIYVAGAQDEVDHVDRRARRRLDSDVLALREARRGPQAGSPKARRKAGRDPSDITTAPFTTVIPLGDAGVADSRAQIISFYIGGMGDYYKELLSGFGYADECKRVDELYRDKKTRAQAADAVSDEMIEALTHRGRPGALHRGAEAPARIRNRPARSSISRRICPGRWSRCSFARWRLRLRGSRLNSQLAQVPAVRRFRVASAKPSRTGTVTSQLMQASVILCPYWSSAPGLLS